jgi:hypothetical protein
MSKYIEQLNPWRSLVGYECEDPNSGNRKIIAVHHPGGYVDFTDGTRGDIHNMSEPHNMTSKLWRVLRVQSNLPLSIERPEEHPLITEAKKRYPPETRFQPAHLEGNPTEICVVGLHENFYLAQGDIYLSHGNTEKNGHNFSEFLYSGGKWAKIVEEPKEESKKYQSFAIACPEDWNTNPVWKHFIEWLGQQGSFGGGGNAIGCFYGIRTDGYPDYSSNKSIFEEIKPFNYIYKLLQIPEIIEKPKEELIESPMDICKKKYPIGATVVSLFGKEATVTGEPFYWKTNEGVLTSDIFIPSNYGDMYVYEAKTGRFAEVKLTKTPESLEELYAIELAEVERLFPEGKTGVFNDWDSGKPAMTCTRQGKLKFDTHEGHARIYSYNGDGILWSTKYGYSTPKTTYERPATPEESFMPKVNGKWIKTTQFLDELGHAHVKSFEDVVPKPNAGQRLKEILFGTPNKQEEPVELPPLIRPTTKPMDVNKITNYTGEKLVLVKPKN